MYNTSAPIYKVDLLKFRKNCEAVTIPFSSEWGDNIVFGYSVKTNRDKRLIKYAHFRLGWFIEMVSPDEYKYCSEMGISHHRMILNGPCKEVLIDNIETNIGYINLDNLDEVRTFCKSGNLLSKVGLRINFDLESECPLETTAGNEVSRFGIDCDSHDLDEAINLFKVAGVEKFGIHLHTSTKTRSLRVFQTLARKAVELRNRYNIESSFVDIGGGFFGGQKISGKPTMEEYARTICEELKKGFNPLSTTLILEPGASVLATCVSYETNVINVRNIRGVKVITVDGTLLHVNPFMAKRNQPFDIKNNIAKRKIVKKQIICGSTCMENDRFAIMENRNEICKGDRLVFYNVGAYTMTFNSYFILNPPKVEYKGEL